MSNLGLPKLKTPIQEDQNAETIKKSEQQIIIPFNNKPPNLPTPQIRQVLIGSPGQVFPRRRSWTLFPMLSAQKLLRMRSNPMPSRPRSLKLPCKSQSERQTSTMPMRHFIMGLEKMKNANLHSRCQGRSRWMKKWRRSLT